MLLGSCLCGTVHYRIDVNDSIEQIIFCHCKRCRKWSGSAFNSAIRVDVNAFMFTQGNDKIKVFSINGVNRLFCGECGSNLLTSRDADKQFYRVRIGTLDTEISFVKKIHIYAASKANWDSIDDHDQTFPESITA